MLSWKALNSLFEFISKLKILFPIFELWLVTAMSIGFWVDRLISERLSAVLEKSRTFSAQTASSWRNCVGCYLNLSPDWRKSSNDDIKVTPITLKSFYSITDSISRLKRERKVWGHANPRKHTYNQFPFLGRELQNYYWRI